MAFPSRAGEGLNLSLLLGGQGSADTHIHFTPLDIVGHLACQAPWSQSKRVSVSLPNQSLSVTAEAHHSKAEDGRLGYDLKIRTSGLVAQMRPAPGVSSCRATIWILLALPLPRW